MPKATKTAYGVDYATIHGPTVNKQIQEIGQLMAFVLGETIFYLHRVVLYTDIDVTVRLHDRNIQS